VSARATAFQALVGALDRILDAAEALLSPRELAALLEIHRGRIERLERHVERWQRRRT
jgi:hypothetical protein